ncbi:MAG TPA: hypothetical protein VG894_02220 [Bauldia sp.]|nr:hypothetical protein [Bauldia sp.]
MKIARKKPKPAAKAPVPAKKRPRPVEPIAIEHRIAVVSVALAVSYGRDRTERMELRGTATLNANVEEGGQRTAGVVILAARKGAKSANRIAYAPASLNRAFVLSLFLDEGDLALFRDLFITGTGPESADPGVVFWARTVHELKTDESGSEPVIEFGFRIDFAPVP